jgi:hypothetical protein
MGHLKLEPYIALPGERFYSDKRKLHNDKSTLLSQPLVALDGEGKNDEENIHHYTHFQALWPTDRRKLVRKHISSRQSLQFLMRLPPKHTYVIFAGNYDANMWLKELLATPSYKVLHDTGECDWQDFHISWVENKYITIKQGKYSRTVYDVFSWYQKSFVKACKDWNVGTPEQLERITAMKERRGDFANVDPIKVEEYCWEELYLLGQLVNKLRESILRTDYRPKGLYGPGALAAAILEKERIKDYYGPYNFDTALSAYYGGRFDSALFGWFENIYQHDIRSAYPDQIRYLPCLRHANWERSNNPATSRYGFYHVKWKVNPDTPYPPFPWRDEDGLIYYPTSGEGWYHADEVRAAMEIYGREIKVIEGEALIEGCDCQPFKFVENLYAWRLLLEAEGNHEQALIVKLCLNSLYGKMAQSIGHKNRPPPFQNFFYAGAITSGTRAKILRAIGRGDGVLSIATDGLVTRERLNLPPDHHQLGDWEILKLLEHVQLGNGIYLSVKENGDRVEKSRGFSTKLIDYTKVREHVLDRGPWGYFEYDGKQQFITLKSAYAQNRPEKACRWLWPESRPHIQLDPNRRNQYDFNLAGKPPPYTEDDILQFERQPFKMQGMSAPFKPKQTWNEIQETREQYYPEALVPVTY